MNLNLGITNVLGGLITQLRKDQRISQAELAERSGLHINTVHLLESGENEPKLSTVFFIAKGLQMDVQGLMELLCSKYYKE